MPRPVLPRATRIRVTPPQNGIVAVARGANTPAAGKPGHVEISGLELRNTTGQDFVNSSGTPEAYWTSSGALYLRGAEHVVVRDCEFHHAYTGLVAENYSNELEVTRDILIERCHFHHNSQAGSYSGHNIQYCRLDPTLNHDLASGIRDRSAGLIFRYNRVDGGAPLLDLIEPTGAISAVTGDARYPTTHVYGNILINREGDGSSLVRFGASYYGDTALARTLLHFYHNTVVLETSSNSRAIFSLPLPATTIETRNNVFHATAGGFQVLGTVGSVNLGVNWANSGWSAGPGGTVNGGAALITGSNPGFINFASADFHPAAGSPLRNASGSLAAEVPSITTQYKGEMLGESRPNTGDLGSYAFSQPVAQDDTAHFTRQRTLKIAAATLLANDSSPLGLPISLASASASSANGGTVRLQGAWLIFEPKAGIFADDSLTYLVTDGTRQSSAVVHLVIDAPPDAPSHNITGTSVVLNGSQPELHLAAAGIPGRTYQLQATASLVAPVSWTNLGSPLTAPANGLMELVDPAPESPRFYRVIESNGL